MYPVIKEWSNKVWDICFEIVKGRVPKTNSPLAPVIRGVTLGPLWSETIIWKVRELHVKPR